MFLNFFDTKNMKKLWFLALWLLCGAILPLTANATIGNWIYTVEGWHKTVIWSGVSMTIAWEDLPGTYYRWFNENTDNSEWIDDSWIWTYYSWGKMYGNTIWVNNAWWWGNDSIENWYNSWLNPERQWPCESWRHVPSPWERSDLLIIRCNVDTWCDASINLEFWDGIYVHMDEIATKFTESLNMDMLHFHWLSSPYHDNWWYDCWWWLVYPYGGGLTIDMDWYSRNYNVRCFKDAPILPETFTVTFLDDGEVVTSWSVVSGGTWNEATPIVIKTWYKLDYRHLTWVNEAFDFTSPITWDITLYAKWSINKDIVIQATSTAANKKIRINKYFANAHIVDRWDGSPVEVVSADRTHTYTWAWTYEIRLSFTWWVDRWMFQSTANGLITFSQMNSVKITSMPSLADGFGASATSPGDYFFYNFNYNWWKITSLPAWSFDTSNITTVGTNFFYNFNRDWQITSLPEWSFRLSTWLTTVWDGFFTTFNSNNWKITSLPVWSFDTSNITTVGDNFFSNFNWYWWRIVSLPEQSFDISKITTVGDDFFDHFNYGWSLTSLPVWSFRLSTWLAIVWNDFFSYFNAANWYSYWQITSLPEWSFDMSNITTAGIYFFYYFNYNWKITNLPDSFKMSSVWASVTDGYYYAFNSSSYTLNRNVSDLVAGVTPPSSDRNTFSDNQPWRCGVHENWLVNASNACNILYDANGWIWTITWWYNSNITGIVPWLNITLPTREWYTLSGWLDASWNIVDEIVFPELDGQTLYANWIPIAYKINYELNDGVISWENVTWYTIESEYITLINPTKTWYTFTWRSGTELNSLTTTVTIPTWSTWDREYEANWQINQYTITFKDWENEIASITADYWTWITPPANPTKNGYTFKWWEPEVPDTMPAENITIKAKWEKVSGWSSGWWGGGWWGWWGGSSSSCKNLPTNAVANNNSTPNSNTNYYYSTNTSKVCTFQCKSGYTRNEEKETCDKASDSQTTSWTNVKEPEANTWSNTKVETWNNTEIQTWSKIDTPEQTPQNDNSNIQDSSTSSQNDGKTYTQEFQEAYEFAHENGITTKNTIQSADMNGKLTRIAMAKMLSQYAINVLWKTPDATLNNKFNDVTDKLDSDYDDWVTLAYQLWIMWQNMPNNKFRPDDEVTRAEFATALSRMLYNTSDWQYKSTDKYYTNHMSKLVKEWIITKDDPKMKELRWYVMIMLMRSAK